MIGSKKRVVDSKGVVRLIRQEPREPKEMMYGLVFVCGPKQTITTFDTFREAMDKVAINCTVYENKRIRQMIFYVEKNQKGEDELKNNLKIMCKEWELEGERLRRERLERAEEEYRSKR